MLIWLDGVSNNWSRDGTIVRPSTNSFERSSTSLGLILVKVLSGAIYGLTITLIFEEIFAYGHFAFWFVLIANLLIFMKVTKKWNFVGVLILDLFLVLVGMILP